MINPMTLCDGYKFSHRQQYPTGTQRVYSNMTPRSSRILGVDYMVTVGLQYFLQKYMMDEMERGFFNTPVDKAIKRYQRRLDTYLGPNKIGTSHIGDLWDLGFMPLEFRALPEGTKVPLRVPMLTVENTLDEFFWVTNYIESLLSNILWLPCTSATTASRYRRILDIAAATTGVAPEFVQWQAHDFSFRGMPGLEAAMLSGMGHLLYFTGTDTVPAIDLIEEYYGVDAETMLIGGSVAATEHSVMCAGGDKGELETYNRLLDLYPSGIVSVVSDTWDLWNVLTNILPQLKDKIMARDGKLVIRPDSGDPVKIICGDPDAPSGNPASKGVIQLLWEVFGGTMTSTGHKMLDSHIGAIYGDSITPERATEITQRLAANGFASGNIVFGVGSFTYQYVTRDTFGTAMKATDVVINGVHHELWKKPVTDNGIKNSARGRLAVENINGTLTLIEQATAEQEAASELKLRWRNGKFITREIFDKMRLRAQNT